jgi:hypothetical protein
MQKKMGDINPSSLSLSPAGRGIGAASKKERVKLLFAFGDAVFIPVAELQAFSSNRL